ncbi:cation:proton antiporter subunit C [Parvibaculum sp.]|jgi:multicomponent Na+:H+ antiporter subunit C|uniref:cation:proton antiporter subunit C n=1 Tax=Parvibaculum sp. TaxID=2024848 RepID=UPI000C8C8859|nr:cation:proton antiporter subunit C [Parvibaculum sp.]MAB15424.1 Na+/H+ antiporter subunit C [Parvibaculum sp.]|tara:strand:- start:130 stop:588 length:459 start_codon:yes stop_codon:yes gene_type:complete
MQEVVFDLEFIIGHYNYWLFVILMMTGLYITVSRGNLIKKVVGLNLFQTSVFMLYISMGKIEGGTAPILTGDPNTVYSNPVPHVLILTAIVVGIATTALALALVVRIREEFGTIEEDELTEIEEKLEFAEQGDDAIPVSGEASVNKRESGGK